jgi:ferredoxin
VPSPFEILAVDEDASRETVKEAYRERVKEAHPDHGGSHDEFMRVRAAYEAIKNGDAEPDTTIEEPVADETEPHDPRPTIEYLNYDVLEDYSWSVEDSDLFEQAAAADLDREDYGTFRAEPRESLLEAAERNDFAWPFACRGGACANCAVLIVEGELSTPIDHILPTEMTDRGIQLSCNGIPESDELKVVYNLKHMPDLEDLLLPPRPWEQTHSD